jgi:hypothetical protein
MPFPILPSNSASGYFLTKSLRFRSSASAYLNRTPASAGTRTTWTFSAWIKRGVFENYNAFFGGVKSSGRDDAIRFSESAGSNQLYILFDEGATGLTTTQLFRDPSAWYHIIVAVDTTQATASNRVKLYVNGSQVTAFATASYPAQNYACGINNNTLQTIGKRPNGDYFDGYMSEVNFIDGQQLTASSFGTFNSLTGVWQPAKYTGTYGTNGFYLPFTDIALTSGSNAGLGKDFSGNGNYWNTNNISVTAGSTYDSMTDVPTLTSATASNYAVWNPLISARLATAGFSNANLTVTGPSGNWGSSVSTFSMATGYKYYSEHKITAIGGSNYVTLGITSVTNDSLGGNTAHSNSTSGIWYGSDGTKWVDGTYTLSAGATYTTNDVIGIAVDCINNQVTFYKNNVSQFTQAFTSNIITNFVLFGIDLNSNSTSVSSTFGQQGFTYTPPTGFVALNTYNLPTSTIVKGNTVMDATLYTGTGATLSATNTAGFKPDFVWIKSRSNALNHNLYDSVRGVQNVLSSNVTSAENYAGTGDLTAFNSNGFTVQQTANYQLSQSGYTYVGWQWQAGQGSTSSNTDGTKTSTVSVNATAGFSICTFNAGTAGNQSFGHGLGVAPVFVIMKDRTTAGYGNWSVFFSGITASNQYLYLNATDAIATLSGVWGSGVPTSTVVNFGSNVNVGANNNCVAYCWTPIAGYSAIGSYTGNGSTDGPFIYTGFRPKFIMVKNSSAAGNGWIMYDTTRNTYNIVNYSLFANESSAENASSLSTENYYDLLSNGFKARTSNAVTNQNGSTLIYMAFAENPFKNALAR